MKKLLTTLLLAVTYIYQAYADTESDYRKYASLVRDEVWAEPLQEFTNPPAVPEKYKDESAIILAAHRYYYVDKKPGIGYNKSHGLKYKFTINTDDYLRTLILINDKRALEKFAEYDLPIKNPGKDGKWYSQVMNERKYVLGLRIIKPDGRIVEVPTDDFIILSQQKKQDKATRQKLAVAGLEIGDKLDLFLLINTSLRNSNPEPFILSMREDYPVLSYTAKCKIDKDLASLYRQHNGATGFTITQDADENYIITKSIQEPIDALPELYYNPMIQHPYVELLSYYRIFRNYRPEFIKKDGLLVNPSAEETIIKDQIQRIEKFQDLKSDTKYHLKEFKGDILSTVKQKFKNKEWDLSRTTEYIYNLLACSYLTANSWYYSTNFVAEFDAALRMTGITDYRKGMVTPRYCGPIDSMINYQDWRYFIYFPDTKQIFSGAYDGYNAASEIHAPLQGQKAILLPNKKLPKKERLAENRWMTFPTNTPYDNRYVTTVTATIDGTDLNINRRIDAFGAAKENVGSLLTTDNLIRAYVADLTIDGIAIDIFHKEDQAKKQARMERNADEAKEQENKIRRLTEKYHGVPPKDFRAYKILECGVGTTPESSAISYDVDYTMNGLVKKAGRNLILNAGDLIGSQAEILPSQRTRLSGDDILLPYPQCNITNTSVELPHGYTVSPTALEHLNSNISNNAGRFSSKAKIDGNKLKITIEKEFPNTRMSASMWNDMVALFDAASQFGTYTILLEKK